MPYIRWIRKQLRSNQPTQPLICTHFDVARPWVLYPYLLHRSEGCERETVIWHPGPGVRECCIDSHDGHALSHWWWVVEQRFRTLARDGLADVEITKALLEQLDIIEGILEEVVPKPTVGEMAAYKIFREDLGLPDIEDPPKKKLPTYARTLGLATWPCSLDDLKQRWRELAKQHHPDRQGDPRKFRACHEAYLKALALLET